MEWYLMAFNKYADFSGRSRRSEYWYFVLFNFLISLALGVVDALIFGIDGFGVFGMIYALGIFLPSIAVAVRRLHDTGRSGWFLLLALIPLVGAIVLLVFFTQDSQEETNKWGPNPKNPQVDLMDHLV